MRLGNDLCVADLLGRGLEDGDAFVRLHPESFLVPVDSFADRSGWARLRDDPTKVRMHRLRSLRADHSPWEPIRVGRGPAVDVRLRDGRVSSHHATFERMSPSGDYLVLDVASRNGLRIDGRPLPAWDVRRVESGALVELGTLALVFLAPHDLYRALAASRVFQAKVPNQRGGRG